MMKSVKGTKTEKNLLISFAGESQARMRYTYFASVAKKEGYEQIAAIFTETADQEKEHAKRMFKFLEGGDVEITAAYPAGMIRNTLENLDEAAKGEEHEYGDMYPSFAKVAEEEGFPEIAQMYRAVSVAEVFHGNRFRTLQENIKMDRVFSRQTAQKWRCRNCGYVHEGLSAPEKCPACLHPQAYFEIAAENY
ncbi:MAG: rubrerythrin [Alphaproteobacteria bacterium]